MCFFFFNDTATTEIYTLSLHDALPIYTLRDTGDRFAWIRSPGRTNVNMRSEEHTSELQSHLNLVCRLLLEKKNNPHWNLLQLRGTSSTVYSKQIHATRSHSKTQRHLCC